MKIDLSTLFEIIEQEDNNLSKTSSPVRQDKQKETALDLQGLFSLFEQLEPQISEGKAVGTGTLATVQKSMEVVNEEEVLKLIIPQVTFSQKSIAAGEDIMSAMKERLTGDTVAERLGDLSTLAKKLDNSPKKTDESFLYLINRIAIIEGIMNVFSNFEAASAGFVNEMVLSSIFPKGRRLSTEESNDNNLVTDFMVNKKHYVLKTPQEKASLRRSSSAYNYLNTLKRTGAITHVDCQKVTNKDKVTGFKVAEFTVTPDTIDNGFISITGGPKMGEDGYFLYKYDSQGKGVLALTGLRPSDLYEMLVQSTSINNYVIARSAKEALTKLQQKVGIEANLIKDLMRQYKVTYGTPKATEQIDFSAGLSEMREVLKQTIREVLEEIKELYTNLQILSSKMGLYFTATNQKNRIREELQQAAAKIDPSTKSITSKMEQ